MTLRFKIKKSKNLSFRTSGQRFSVWFKLYNQSIKLIRFKVKTYTSFVSKIVFKVRLGSKFIIYQFGYFVIFKI